MPLMAGNWKMNLTHLEAIALVQKLAFTLPDMAFYATEVWVPPPFTAPRSVQTLVSGDKLRIRYGSQDISPHGNGAYTGDVSGSMLAKLGCAYAVVGHSERRRYHGEDDATVNAKARAALGSGITPIVCVGEDLATRRAGDHLAYILAQLDGALTGIGAPQIAGLVVAYEPVWAIGTGEVARPEDAQEACQAIRERVSAVHGHDVALDTRILYGRAGKAHNNASITGP